MALCVTTIEGDDFHWWEGQTRPKMLVVKTLIANANELALIKQKFINIPISNKSDEITWSGDFAQFIWDNL